MRSRTVHRYSRGYLHRLLSPIVDVRRAETNSLFLMFLYSFLIMASYNIVKPLTRAQFIDDVGAKNLPFVLLVAGVLIGVIMQGCARLIRWLPSTAVIPTTHLVMAGFLVRRDVAAAIRHVGDARSHDLLIPLLHDWQEVTAARWAIEHGDRRLSPRAAGSLRPRLATETPLTEARTCQ